MIEARVVSTARGPVEVAETGSGPAVLFIHGTPGDWRQVRPLAEDLADRYRVILPSRPGYGRTPLSSGRTPAEQAAAYTALLDTLGVSSAAVVGVSGGGPSAYAFAAEHRDRCTAVVLCAAVMPHLIDAPRYARWLGWIPGLWAGGARIAAWQEQRLLNDPVRVRARVNAELSDSDKADLARDPTAYHDVLTFLTDRIPSLKNSAGIRNDFRMFPRTDPVPWRDGVPVPSLVLHGDVDTVVPLEHGDAYAKAIPGSLLEVQAGGGHAFVLVHRKAMGVRIAEFLAEAGHV